MSETFASLLDEVQARGAAPAIRLADREISHRDLLAGVGQPPTEGVVVLAGMGTLDAYKTALHAWRGGGVTFFVSPRQPARPAPDLTLGAAATLLNTSGSSGTPRIAVHRLERHIQSARAAAAFFELGSDDTWLLSLPTYHVGGLGIVFRCLVTGAVLAMPGPDEALGAALVRTRPTHVSLVTTQLKRLLEDDRHAQGLADCRAVLVGGGAIPGELRRRALLAGVPLHVSYGSTETTALVAATGDAEVAAMPCSAGRSLPGRRIEIAADGEIRVGGEGLFDGYLENGRVVSPLDEDGFYATGDIGRVDHDFVLYVEGRKDRMLVSGGENIYPEEIENMLATVPGVSAAVVVGVEDAEFGARPVAFVQGDVTGAALEAALRERLPGFKVPDAFYALPYGPSGLKPDIARLTERLRDPDAYEDLLPL